MTDMISKTERLYGDEPRSLYEIVYDKVIIEDTLTEGEITDEMDLIWQNNELELKDKVDSYGNLILHTETAIEELDKIKEIIDKRKKRNTSLIERLKRRIAKVADGLTLRGNLYTFSPYISTKHFIKEPALLKPEETYLTIEIKEDHWNQIWEVYGQSMFEDNQTSNVSFKIISKKGKVSELPEDHPAVGVTKTPSVRIT